MDLARIEQLLASLNEHQRAVAEIGPGACAVTGVPGAGKTATLVARVARLARDGLDPRYVLGMTFTRAAAAEMNERLTELGVLGCRISTIHSLSNDILRKSIPMITAGLTLDESGFKASMELERALGDLRRDKIIQRSASPDVDGLKRFICTAKASGICPVFGNPFGTNAEALKRIESLALQFKHQSGGLYPQQLVHLYEHLEHRRAAARTFDYDDMQLWAWMGLLTMPDESASWQSCWSLIMVDEKQDSNAVQWDLARLLAGGKSRLQPELTPDGDDVPSKLTIYGDPAQSIYGFRAAVPSWFVDFATTKGVGLYTLPINYRSSPEICWISSRLVDGKSWHLGGEIQPADGQKPTPEGMTEALKLQGFADMHLEATALLDWLESKVKGDWTQGAVLARLAMFLHVVEIECIRRQIPYEKRASGGFADSHEVQDLLAYLRVAGGWDPDRKWMRRCVRAPFRYIGRDAMSWADQAIGDGYWLGALMSAPMLSSRQRRSLGALEATLETLELMIRRGERPDVCLRYVIDDTEYLSWLKEKGGAITIDASKLAVIDHLLAIAACYDTAAHLLSHVDQLTAGLKIGRQRTQITEGNRLVLSTIHRSKGLEWTYVAIGDMGEGRFPWNRGDSADEELRLLYVACSRARQGIFASWSGVMSPFATRLRTLSESLTGTEKHRGSNSALSQAAALT